jgi:hypothetical protein
MAESWCGPRRTRGAQRRPRRLEAVGGSAPPAGRGQLREAEGADAEGGPAPAGHPSPAPGRAGGGPPAATGQGRQAERRRSTGEAPSAPGRPGRRRSPVQGQARQRPRRSLRTPGTRSGGTPRTGGRPCRQDAARPGNGGQTTGARSTLRPPPGGREPPQPEAPSASGGGPGSGVSPRSGGCLAGRPSPRTRPVEATRGRQRCPQRLCGPLSRPSRRACQRNAPGPTGGAAVPLRKPTARAGPWACRLATTQGSHGPGRSGGPPAMHTTLWMAATALAPAGGRGRRSETSPATGKPGRRGRG